MSRLRKRKRSAARVLGVERLEERRLLANVPTGFTESVLAGGLTSPTTFDIEESGRIWVAFQDGRIEVIEPGGSGTNFAYQLDADGSAEHGLQGIELDPHFEENHYIYVYYTANTPEPHNRLSRLTVDHTTENTILAGSEVPLLELPNLSEYGNPPWHIGGAIHFDSDGHLYVQIGESQQAALSQDLDSPLGKVFRVNSDGTIPADNPYYNAGDGITWRDYVWASGLRNPFAGDLDPVTGQYLIADVGAGSWEEINDATQPGLNFGWPATEGHFNTTQFPHFTEPLYAYSHAQGCAITGLAFNNGGTNPFPAEYQGMVFFAEFCGGDIRVIDPNNPAATNSADVFATGADFPMNIEFGPDGALYYISRGAGAGGAPGVGEGTIRRIAYAADSPPSIVAGPADQLATIGASVELSVSATGTSPFAYQWQESDGGPFVDIAGATAQTLVLNNVQLTDTGKSYRVVVTNSLDSVVSAAAVLTVTSDTPPVAQIDSPHPGATYRAGDVINVSGAAFDAEDGALEQSQLTWRVDFHHNVHSHPFIAPTSGIDNLSFEIPTLTETDDDVWYRITLTATDSAGLSTSTFVDVLPEKSDFVVATNLPDSGGLLTIDGHVIDGPFVDTGVINVQRTLEAGQVQEVEGQNAYFYQWLDGETSPQRTIVTPEDDTAYVAIYRTFNEDFVYVSDLLPSETPINGWGPIELDTSNGEDLPGDGGAITLNGVTYDKGLGVHSYSEVTYNLGGQYSRFLSDIGIDDEANGTVVFRVLGDGVELYNSGTMGAATQTQTVDVDLLGVSVLKLIVDDNGDGDGMDHADWADARLTIAASDPLVNINFQTDTSTTPGGDFADTGQLYGNQGNGWSYGWSSDHTDVSRDRDLNADQRSDTLVHFHNGADWEIELPNGTYLVTASVGDAGFTSTHTLNVEGVSYWANETLAANEFAVLSQQVVVTDGRLTLDQGAAADKATRINYLEIAVDQTTAALLPFAAADVNLNGRLNLDDALDFAAGWGADGTTLSLEARVRQGDLDFDGDTDLQDWQLFNAKWLSENNTPISLDALLNPLPGDYNRNGSVTQADVLIWRSSFGSSSSLAADGSGDGVVDSIDYAVWRENLGATGGIAPFVDNLVLYVDPATGEGYLSNDTPAAVELIGYTIESQGASLLPADGQWNSLSDQGFAGWDEASPTSQHLSELSSSGMLTFAPGQTVHLGTVFDIAQPISGLSLEFVVLSSTEAIAGVAVFGEFLSAVDPPTAGALPVETPEAAPVTSPEAPPAPAPVAPRSADEQTSGDVASTPDRPSSNPDKLTTAQDNDGAPTRERPSSALRRLRHSGNADEVQQPGDAAEQLLLNRQLRSRLSRAVDENLRRESAVDQAFEQHDAEPPCELEEDLLHSLVGHEAISPARGFFNATRRH